MDSIPVGRAVLQKVVTKLGSHHAAADYLGVPYLAISRYLDGTSPVPDDLLLRLVEMVVDEWQAKSFPRLTRFHR